LTTRKHWKCVVRPPKAKTPYFVVEQLPPTGSPFKVRRQSTGTLDRAKAEEMARAREAELNGCVVVKDGTWAAMWDAYYEYRKADGETADGTLEKLRSLRAVFLPHLGKLRMSEIDETRLTLVQDAVRKDRAGVTVNTYFALLREGWRWGKKRGFVSFVMPDITRLEVRDTNKRPFTKAECEQVLMGSLDFCGGRWYSVLRCAYETGCRISEACELRERDVDRVTGSVLLNGRKTKTERRVFVSLETLATFPQPRPSPDDRLFITRNGNPANRKSAYEAFRRICELNKIDHTETDLHSFRRTMVEDLVRTPGLPLPVAQKITGHRSLKVFLHYQDKAKDDMSVVSEAVRAFRSSQVPSQNGNLAGAIADAAGLSEGPVRAGRSDRLLKQVLLAIGPEHNSPSRDNTDELSATEAFSREELKEILQALLKRL
jgi:integrase